MRTNKGKLTTFEIIGVIGSIIYFIGSFLPFAVTNTQSNSMLNGEQLNDGIFSPWIFIPVAFGMAVLFLSKS